MSRLIAALPDVAELGVERFTTGVKVFEPTAARCTCTTAPCCCCTG
ncbi:plantazolicin family TOMM peptide [Rhodococcus sp. 14-2483-1-2]|nr:plantazolicin family TOMM peptide [Rhodococcus sp. 14-2483-1-2]OZF25997.1 hypothetical protein CH295_25460 [Rhodococcus sp. 14-2483-1-2]